jgi:hypothetical protein
MIYSGKAIAANLDLKLLVFHLSVMLCRKHDNATDIHSLY